MAKGNLPTSAQVIRELKKYIEPDRAHVLSSFFKTGHGQYGEGDKFLGIAVPQTRLVAKRNLDIGLDEISKLIQNPFHEVRLCALIMMSLKVEKLYKVHKKKSAAISPSYEKSVKAQHEQMVRLYLKYMTWINNWDLVDTSAYHIYGSYLYMYKKTEALDILLKHAKSKNIWERRITMISTLYMIRVGESFEVVIEVARSLMLDTEDLIQKAVGWMLRELGKKDKGLLKVFLDSYAGRLPRTTLRYAIEHFDAKERCYYMDLKRSV